MPNRAIPSTFRCSPRARSARRTEAHAQRFVFFSTCVLSKRLVGVEEDGDRAFIDKLDGHHSLKYPGRYGDSKLAKPFGEFFIERFRLVRWSGGDEARPALPSRVAVERELRDNQRAAVRVEQRSVHLSLLVFEDSQIGNFFGERSGGCGRVLPPNTQENHQPRSKLPRCAAARVAAPSALLLLLRRWFARTHLRGPRRVGGQRGEHLRALH